MARCKNVGGSPGTPGGDGGDDRPRRLMAAEKGKGKKVMTKKRKTNDHEVEIAEVVAAVVEAAERGGQSCPLQIGSDLMLAQRCAVFQVEQ